jgi:outer membrane protein assembly factor BamB
MTAAQHRSIMRVLLAALFLMVALAPAAQADWLSFHNDSRNTGSLSFSTYPVFKEVWWNNKTLANAQIQASPVIKDNIVITADKAGLVRALDGASGSQLWYYKMPAQILGTPAIEGERVYVAAKDGTLNAFSLHPPKSETAAAEGIPGGVIGVVENTVNVGPTQGSIALNEGRLFIGTEAGEMKAYLASTLAPLWTFLVSTVSYTSSTTTGGVWSCTGGFLSAAPIYGKPAVFGGKVFFGSLNHAVFAVSEAGGTGLLPDGTARPASQTQIMWVAETGNAVVSSPAINTRSGQSDRVVFTSTDGKVYSFTTTASGEGTNRCYGATHTPTWTYNVPSIEDPETGTTQISQVESSPAAAGSRIFFGANNGNMYAVDSSNGALLWEKGAGGVQNHVTSSPAIANGIVVVGSHDKNVYWFNATDGKQLNKFATEDAVLSSAAIDGNRAFISAKDGVTYMFGPEIPRRADLQVTGFTPAGSLLQVTVKNAGDAATSANTTLRILVAGTFFANVNVPTLDAGEETAVLSATAIPGTGVVVIEAIVDPDDTIDESDDSNNDLTQGVDFTPAAAPGGKKDDGGGGFKIPGLGLVPTLAVLALALLALRRRR